MKYEDISFPFFIVETDTEGEETPLVAQDTTTGVGPGLPDHFPN
jgi:hypothetical protein